MPEKWATKSLSLFTFLEVKEKVRPSFESNSTDLDKVRESELIFCILVQRKNKKILFQNLNMNDSPSIKFERSYLKACIFIIFKKA